MRHTLKFAAMLIAVATLASLTFAPEAFAAGLPVAHHFPAFDHATLSSLAVHASAALVALRADHAALVSRAEAKLAEIKDDTPAEAARRIESEHQDLVRQIEQSRSTIATKEREEAEATRTAPPAPVDPTQIRAEAERAERERAESIRTLAEPFGQRAFADEHVRSGTGVEAFRGQLLDKLREAQPQIRGNTRVEVHGASEEEKRAGAIESALLHRFDPRTFQLSEHGREYRGMTLLEIGRDCLEHIGQRTRGLSKNELADAMLGTRSAGYGMTTRGGGMQSTSDFPNVLANVANKTLRAGYNAAPQTFKPLVRVVTVPDFKTVKRVQLGEAPQLQPVNEHGEFERGKIGDAGESYAIATFGKIVAITRQVLINDDLNAFTRIPRMFGVQAANLESDLVWAQITTNPNMADGQPLFSAAHGNVGTSAPIAVAGVGAGRVAMTNQTGLDGKTLINVVPTYILVPTALQTVTEQFLGQIFATKSADAVPDSMKKLIPISDPRLDRASTSNWYLAADPAQIDTIELAYLEGAEGVYTETRMGFDVDGIEVKVRQDAGAKVIEPRAFWKNPN